MYDPFDQFTRVIVFSACNFLFFLLLTLKGPEEEDSIVQVWTTKDKYVTSLFIRTIF